MIRKFHELDKIDIQHSQNLKAFVTSLFRFQEDRQPADITQIDVTTITYVNYNKLIENIKNAISAIKSEVIFVDPSGLKDSLLILKMAIDRVTYNVNMTDTRLEHLREYLLNQPSWKRNFRWNKVNEAFVKYEKLEENQKKFRKILTSLERVSYEFQRAIRQIALAVVKSRISKEDRAYINDVEILEEALSNLRRLQLEIGEQMYRKSEFGRVTYYEVDRTRFLSFFGAVDFSLQNLTALLTKLQLDADMITELLNQAEVFKIKKGLRWVFSDRYVFRRLMDCNILADNLIVNLERTIQPESQKLHMYANQVLGIGRLMDYEQAPAGSQSSAQAVVKAILATEPLNLSSEDTIQAEVAREDAPLVLSKQEVLDDEVLDLGQEEITEYPHANTH